MATVTIKSSDSDNQVIVDSTGHLLVSGTVSDTNPSVSITGTTAPISATEVAGIDSSGNLHPIAVNSSGAVEVVGSLTTTQGFSVISVGPTQISVGTNSTQLLAANPSRLYAHIINNTSNTVYIQYSSSAALNQGIKLSAGGFLFISGGDLYLGVVNAIALMPNQLIDIIEGI